MGAKFAFNCSITVLWVGPIFASSMINVIIRMLMSSILYLFIITERNWRFEILLDSRPHSWHVQYANIIDIWLLSVEQIDLKREDSWTCNSACEPKNAFIIFIYLVAQLTAIMEADTKLISIFFLIRIIKNDKGFVLPKTGQQSEYFSPSTYQSKISI